MKEKRLEIKIIGGIENKIGVIMGGMIIGVIE